LQLRSRVSDFQSSRVSSFRVRISEYPGSRDSELQKFGTIKAQSRNSGTRVFSQYQSFRFRVSGVEGFRVSEFRVSHSFRVSEFQGFRVSDFQKFQDFNSEIVVISETSYLITDLGQLQIYTARLSVCSSSEFQSFRGSVFQGFRVQSFRVSEFQSITDCQSFRVSEFQSFKVSEFSFIVSDSQDYQSFRVSVFHQSFRVSVFHQSFRAGFQGFRVSRVSGFQFQSFRFQTFSWFQSFSLKVLVFQDFRGSCSGFQSFRFSGFQDSVSEFQDVRVFLQKSTCSLLTNLDQLCAGLSK
jgi:hypothetical protein